MMASQTVMIMLANPRLCQILGTLFSNHFIANIEPAVAVKNKIAQIRFNQNTNFQPLRYALYLMRKHKIPELFSIIFVSEKLDS